MKNTMALIAAMGLIASFALTGCETTKGAGRDIENAGEGIQRTARDLDD